MIGNESEICKFLFTLLTLFLMLLLPFHECPGGNTKLFDDIFDFPSLVAVFVRHFLDIVWCVAGPRPPDRKLLVTVITAIALGSGRESAVFDDMITGAVEAVSHDRERKTHK